MNRPPGARPASILSFGSGIKDSEDYIVDPSNGPSHLARNRTERFRTQGLALTIRSLAPDATTPRKLRGTWEKVRLWMVNEGGSCCFRPGVSLG